MRRFLLGLMAIVALIGGTALFSAPAQADRGSPTCVTRAEYRQVHRGMTKASVDREFGIHGKRFAGATSADTAPRSGPTDRSRFSVVSIAFSANPGGPLRLSAKSAVWSY